MEKEILEKIISESKNLTDVLSKLKLRAAGDNYETIKKYINIYGISTSHFLCERHYFRSKIPTKELLINGSTYNRSNLKERLYKEGIKERKCELCGQNEYWFGKKMSLILDHINGVWNDNRLENLQIVCANCNATLDTHCGKNKSKKRKAKKNGISDKRIEAYINMRKVDRPEYNILLSDIDILGYSGTGRKYGVSDNAIRKWLKQSYSVTATTTGSDPVNSSSNLDMTT